MRHRKNDSKLGRTSAHRRAMLANLACSLIEHGRVVTTTQKAKACKPLVEKMITLGKKGTVEGRRIALKNLKQKRVVNRLFKDIAPLFSDRSGGYTRILRLPRTIRLSANETHSQWRKAYGLRLGDGGEQVYFELVGYQPPTYEAEAEAGDKGKAGTGKE